MDLDTLLHDTAVTLTFTSQSAADIPRECTLIKNSVLAPEELQRLPFEERKGLCFTCVALLETLTAHTQDLHHQFLPLITNLHIATLIQLATEKKPQEHFPLVFSLLNKSSHTTTTCSQEKCILCLLFSGIKAKKASHTSLSPETLSGYQKALNSYKEAQKYYAGIQESKKVLNELLAEEAPAALTSGLEMSFVNATHYNNYYEPLLIRKAVKAYRTTFMQTGDQEKAVAIFNTVLKSVIQNTLFSPELIRHFYIPTYTPETASHHTSYYETIETLQAQIAALLTQDGLIINDAIHTLLMSTPLCSKKRVEDIWQKGIVIMPATQRAAMKSKEREIKKALHEEIETQQLSEGPHPPSLLIDIAHKFYADYIRPRIVTHTKAVMRATQLKEWGRFMEQAYSSSTQNKPTT